MPITAEQFDKGKRVETQSLSEVMEEGSAYTTPEVSELVGKSWGVAKNMLLEAIEEGNVAQRKIGRSIYFRYYADGIPEELREEMAAAAAAVEKEE